MLVFSASRSAGCLSKGPLDIKVRPVQAEDLEAMHRLYESLAGETRSSLSLDGLKKDFENSRSVFLSALSAEGGPFDCAQGRL